MFDNIKAKIKGYSVDEFEALLSRVPYHSLTSAEDKATLQWGCLRVRYYPCSQILEISNSIHKFYNEQIGKIGAINHNDYTLKQVEETFLYISKHIKRPLSDFKLFGHPMFVLS